MFRPSCSTGVDLDSRPHDPCPLVGSSADVSRTADRRRTHPISASRIIACLPRPPAIGTSLIMITWYACREVSALGFGTFRPSRSGIAPGGRRSCQADVRCARLVSHLLIIAVPFELYEIINQEPATGLALNGLVKTLHYLAIF